MVYNTKIIVIGKITPETIADLHEKIWGVNLYKERGKSNTKWEAIHPDVRDEWISIILEAGYDPSIPGGYAYQLDKINLYLMYVKAIKFGKKYGLFF